MNIVVTGTKVTLDTCILAFQKNNLVDTISITVDTDDTWQYKLDVKLPKTHDGNGNLYNVIDLVREGNTCTVALQSSMLPFRGRYVMQLRGISGDKVYHTDTFFVLVEYSIDPGAVYNPIPSEFYQIEQEVTNQAANAKQYEIDAKAAKEAAQSSQERAELAAKESKKFAEQSDSASEHSPKIGQNGNWLLWDPSKNIFVDTGTPATGPQGEKGPAGVADISLSVTGATVGQIAKITAVDGTGKPTAWEAVDMPSGGGGSTVNNNTINQYFYNSMATGKYDLKSGYGTTADIYIAADGTETAISGLDYAVTDYIPVGANTAYVAYCNGYALYNKEKTFVSAVIDRSNHGTIKEFTTEQDGYARITYRLAGDGTMQNFARFCEKSEIKKAPRDYMPATSPFFDIRIPCNVDLYGDSNSYGYGLSDTANAWSNRLGALLLSMPEKITNGARYEMSVFANIYSGRPKLRNNGVVYMSAYTDKFTVNGEYITAVDVYIDGVQQEQMTASPAEYTCPLGYHEIELRGKSGPNNVIKSIATNKTRSFTNHAVTGSKSDNLPDIVDGNVEIVMYGTNDRGIEYGKTANNMARFYSACEAAGAKVYFLSPIPTKVEGETDASYVQTISDVISQIPDINYIDVYKDMQLYSLLSTETLYSDKLHLNDFGHKVLFCIVASKLHLAALNSIFGV